MDCIDEAQMLGNLKTTTELLEEISAKLDILIRHIGGMLIEQESDSVSHEKPATKHTRPEDEYVFGSKDERFYRYRP
jgi:hypothetical protein